MNTVQPMSQRLAAEVCRELRERGCDFLSETDAETLIEGAIRRAIVATQRESIRIVEEHPDIRRSVIADAIRQMMPSAG